MNGTSLPEIPKLLSTEQKTTVSQYVQLQAALQQCLVRLENLGQTNPVFSHAKRSVTTLLAAADAPENTDGFSNVVELLQRATADIDGSASSGPSETLDDIVQRVTAVVQSLSPQEDSELATVVEEIVGGLDLQVSGLQREVQHNCRFIESGMFFLLRTPILSPCKLAMTLDLSLTLN